MQQIAKQYTKRLAIYCGAFYIEVVNNAGDEEMKNADMPAMPSDVKAVYEAMTDSADSWGKAALGLTKREMMAMHIAAGLASDPDIKPSNIPMLAINVSDALLAALEVSE